MLVIGTVVAWFLNVEAGIAQWSPPKIQFATDGAGTSFMCAVADNKVYCWGSVNTYGQLGTGDNTTVSYIPRQINDPNGVLVGKTITAITVARTGTVCVVASNVPYCWGRGNYGALGDNTTSDRYYPSAVTTSGVLAGKTITAMGAGDGHVCVVASGAAYCWGAGGNGRLGDGGTSQRNTPVAVSTSGVLSGKTVTSVSGLSGSTCAVASGASYCWGSDTNGYLGNDTAYADSLTPVAVNTSGVMSGKTIVRSMSGTNHTCALASDSTAFCWGEGAGGQLGNNATPANSAVPVQVYASGAISGKTLTKISAGNGRSCVIDSNGDAYCWGMGPVGDGTSALKSQPTKITGSSTLNGMKIYQTVNSGSGSCFLTALNKLFCASSGAGILGNNTSGTSSAPVQVLFTSTFNAPNYRIYANADSATPGSPLAGINTAATLTSSGQAFRVRLGIKTTPQIGSLVSGGAHTCGISDGKAYCWGLNTYGQLGNNSTSDSWVPVAVDTSGVLSGKTIKSLSAGQYHTCAIASDNQVYCWGYGAGGRLGNNSSAESHVPVAVTTSGVLSGKTVIAISVGGTFSCAIASDNQAYCWGTGTNGQLGNAGTSNSTTPVAVDTSGVLSGKKVLSISSGYSQTCVVASDNLAYCWGYNNQGQLGDNSTTQRPSPVAVNTAGVLSGKTILSVSAHGVSTDTHTCAIASDNLAYCWGRNFYGQLGNNSTSDSSVPVAVNTAGVLSGKTVNELMTSTSHSCVATLDSGLYCWGLGTYGRLGNNLDSNTSVAIAAPLLEGYVNGPAINPSDNTYKLQFAQKTLSTCSVQTGFADVTDSTAVAFNTNGSVSNGASITSNANDPVPTTDSVPQAYISASGTFTNTSTITGGKTGLWDFSLKDNSNLYATSYCLRMTYGDGTPIEGVVQYPEFTTPSKMPVTQSSYRLYQNANSITPGTPLASTDTVATLSNLGQGFRVRVGLEPSVTPLSVKTGDFHTCGIFGDSAYCWGDNTYGQLGNADGGTNYDAPSAVDTSGVLAGKTILSIAAGSEHTCAIASDNKPYCWGNGGAGRLGDNDTAPSDVPVAVDTTGVLSGKTVLSIVAGYQHTCVIASDNKPYCWGSDANGQLGDGSGDSSSYVPVAVDMTGVLSGKTVLSLAAVGSSHTCAIASDNKAYCWGLNDGGQLGDGTANDAFSPVAVNATGLLSGKTVTALATGWAHSCAIASGDAYCWGQGGTGRLGDGLVASSYDPVAVDTSGVLSGLDVTAIAADAGTTCVIASDNRVYCWGAGTSGQLGDTSNSNAASPVMVDDGGAISGKVMTSISVGDSHTCATSSDNGVYCWGLNTSGQLGNSSNTASNSPVTTDTGGLPSGGGDITSGANSYKLQFAQKTVGSCSAQTGFTDVTDSSAIAYNTNPGVTNGAIITATATDPVPTTDSIPQTYRSSSGTFTNTSAITDGKTGLFDFSLRDNSNTYSTTYCLRLTYGDGTPIEGTVQYPEFMTAPKIDLKQSSYRFYQNVNSLTPGTALANANTATALVAPSQAFRLRTGIRSLPKLSGLTAGHNVTCAISSGKGYCWGQNDHGQMGRGVVGGQYDNSSTPIAIDTSGVLSGKTLLSISTGGMHTCAIASDNLAYCWGDNTYGQLGDNSTTQRNSPVAVNTSGVLSGKTILSISASETHTCAIASDNLAYCWGSNTYGQLGNNSTTESHVPVAVYTAGVLSGKTVLSISGGGEFTCAVASDNLAYCWGLDSYGSLGNPSVSNAAIPNAVDMSGVLSGKTILSVDTGDIYSTRACAIASDNKAYCWGRGDDGQLGNGVNASYGSPVAVDTSGALSGKSLTAVQSGSGHTCVLDTTGTVYCWGINWVGQTGVGYGSETIATPAYVVTDGYIVGVDIATGANTYKLQYAQKTVSSCSAQTGFADVTAATPIAFNTNAGVTNGASITTNANDPVATSDSVAQTYVSAIGAFTNSSDITGGKAGLWDFSLKDNGAPYNTTYCLRIAYNDGTALTDTQSMPEVTTTTGTLSVGFVDYMGSSLSNPTTTFNNITAVTSTWQQTSATLGMSTQKLRIYNDFATNGWNASIAATGGPTASWDRTDHLVKYDFNDAQGPIDGAGDSDSLGGALIVMPQTSTIMSPSGCGTSGLSLGSLASFSEGVTNSITLLTANNTAAMGCAYDLTDTGLIQLIPAAQATGTYTLDMTITVVAL